MDSHPLTLHSLLDTDITTRRLERYFTVSMNLIPETNGLPPGEVIHARVIGIVHKVEDG